ncbi:putative G-protein coupled receptor 139 [Acipenser ruthenus]|uniref:Putative G-protein coupled receptor 139 n=1 Tax=Acipenser ruthenus TaxID=7906 RepID=A0A662YNM1_ACIRT|nr:putative G-protein coupled receptor 139 [Acipenser ruthenus]
MRECDLDPGSHSRSDPTLRQRKKAANLLTIFVLSCRPCGMSKTTVTYLLSLSVVDTLFMILGGLVDVTLSWSHSYPLQSCSDALLCGIITFNEYWTLSSSQWIVAAFTLECYLVLRNGSLRRRFSRPRVALSVVLAVVLVCQIISIPSFWLYQAQPASSSHSNYSLLPVSYRCLHHSAPLSRVVVWIHTLAAACLPMAVNISFSVLIALHFQSTARVFRDSQSRVISNTRARLRRSSRLQALVTVTSVVLTLPCYVIYCLLGTDTAISEQEREDPQDSLNVAAQVGFMLQWLKLVINFCMYCFVSSAFRAESMAVLRCRGWRGQSRGKGRRQGPAGHGPGNRVVRAADGSMNPSGREEIRNIARTEPQQEGQVGSDDAVNSPQPECGAGNDRVTDLAESLELGMIVTDLAESLELGMIVTDLAESLELGMIVTDLAESVELGMIVTDLAESLELGMIVTDLAEMTGTGQQQPPQGPAGMPSGGGK